MRSGDRTFGVVLAVMAVAGFGVATVGGASHAPAQEMPPAVGAAAPDFTLEAVGGGEVSLKGQLDQGPVVLVVLRGYPGYQCPLCTRQVAELRAVAARLAEAGARVVMVYPGASRGLQARAKEFLSGTTLPPNFTLVTDPEYTFTTAYHLRWDAPQETAYPSTFVIDREGVVRYAKVSRTHGDRAPAREVVEAVQAL